MFSAADFEKYLPGSIVNDDFVSTRLSYKHVFHKSFLQLVKFFVSNTQCGYALPYNMYQLFYGTRV